MYFAKLPTPITAVNGFGFYVQVSHGFGEKKGRRQNSGDGCLKKWMNFLDLINTINGISRLRARRMARFEAVMWRVFSLVRWSGLL